MYIVKRKLNLNDPELRGSMIELLREGDNIRELIDECVYDPYAMCALKDALEELVRDDKRFEPLYEYADECVHFKMDLPCRALVVRHDLSAPIGAALDTEFEDPSMFLPADAPDVPFIDRLRLKESKGAAALDRWLEEIYSDFYGAPGFDELFRDVLSRYKFYRGCRSDIGSAISAVYEKYVKASKRYIELN